MPVFLMYVFTKPPPRFSPGGGCIGVVILMRLGAAGGYDCWCMAEDGSGYLRDLFALFGFSCLSVFHAANVGIVDLHSLWCVFGPLHTNNFLKRLII